MKSIKTYQEYIGSNVVWLKEVPKHWKVIKSKRIFIESSIKGFPDEELLAATQTKGVIPKSMYENTTVTATKNFETLKLVEKGDFVISLRSFQGGIEYAHFRGIISPAYTVLKPSKKVVHKYFRYLLKSKRYISGLKLLVTGIREGQNIDTTKFKNSYLPLPPKPEQTTIANFLDYKLEKINRFISKKKQLIELLHEQKAAIINQAVTKGLDPNVKMKDSGIEWLGEIPEHWEVRKLRTIIKYSTLGGNYNCSETDEGIPLMKMGNLDRGFMKLNKIEYLKPDEEYEEKHILKEGDFLFNTRNSSALVGKVSLWRNELPFSLFNSNILKIDFKKGFINEYLNYLFNSKPLLEILKLSSKGTTNVSAIYYKDLSLIKIWIPENIAEQQQIVNYIETETKKIDKTISTIEKEITLVEEYKTALIAETVTGKIDVREWCEPMILNDEMMGHDSKSSNKEIQN